LSEAQLAQRLFVPYKVLHWEFGRVYFLQSFAIAPVEDPPVVVVAGLVVVVVGGLVVVVAGLHVVEVGGLVVVIAGLVVDWDVLTVVD
jgi:hypothetical protein